MTEIQSGSSGATSRAATIAAFAFSVSKIVSIRSRSTPPSTQAADLLRVGGTTSSNDTARYAGSSTFGESESVDVQRPERARDEAVARLVHACRASRAPSTFIS